MKKLTQRTINDIIRGTSVLGCGGGGKLTTAKELVKQITNPITLLPLEKITDTDLVVTVFGIGGLKSAGNAKVVTEKNISILERLLNKKITGLIPVETGPMSIANVFLTASLRKLPVIDADLVGYRAAPEIYLEIISLANINRLPLVASNANGDSIILENAASLESLEKILRNFSAQSPSKVYVAGYPLTKIQLQNCLTTGSVSFCQKVGKILKNPSNVFPQLLKNENIVLLGEGIIISQTEKQQSGFTAGEITIASQCDVYTVMYKNEFLVLLKNRKPILTCPDSIFVIDMQTNEGINNGDDNRGKNVFIFGRKAISAWRTSQGKKLFSPKKLGYPFPQILLK